ncbi:MAG: hypothetical protein IPK58_25350 [Acidobacteria bacterium]|nr:hypothetical protein [Acidobacteriota bacterium]
MTVGTQTKKRANLSFQQGKTKSYRFVSDRWFVFNLLKYLKWSWANETVDAANKRDMNKIKEFGEKNQYKELTTPQLKCEENYG